MVDVGPMILQGVVWMLDFKFLVGTLLGWRFVTQVFGGPQARPGHDALRQLQELRALVAALRKQLSQHEAEIAKKDRDLADVTSQLQEAEFARLTLESQVCQLEAQGVRLEAEVEAAAERDGAQRAALAAANVALRKESDALLAQLQELRQLLAQERAAAAAAVTAAAPKAGSSEPSGAKAAQVAELHGEAAALREQLAFVSEQNMVLQERLMALAFTTPADPLEGAMFSPEPRRPRHRPLAEDEEIQRRIAQSAAQVKLFEDDGEEPGSPFLAAAQRQLEAYQQIKQHLAGGRGEEETAPTRTGSAHGEGSLRLSDSSGTGSPSASGSPTGVLSSQGSAIGLGLDKPGPLLRGTVDEGEEVSSAAL